MSNRATNQSAQPESHEAWVGATAGRLSESKDATEKLRSMLEMFEQREKDRLAAEAAERRRQALLAAQAEERRLREAERQRQLAFKKSQADALGEQVALVKQAKLDEAEAIKEATRRFKQAAREEREAKEKQENLLDLKVQSKKVLGAVLGCKKTSSMIFSQLKVCEKRMAMRAEMPLQERFKDDVHEALEHQHLVLTSSRNSLHDFCQKATVLKDEMRRVMVLIATDRSRENVVRRMEKSFSLPTLQNSQKTQMNQSTMLSIPEVESLQDLLHQSRDLLQKALTVIHIAENLIKETNAACDSAANRVNERLDLRKSDTDTLRRHIMKQKKEVEAMISDADARISDSAGVATEDELLVADEIARQCQVMKSRLDEDYRCKMNALKIDTSCRTLTKVRAGGHREPKARNGAGST